MSKNIIEQSGLLGQDLAGWKLVKSFSVYFEKRRLLKSFLTKKAANKLLNKYRKQQPASDSLYSLRSICALKRGKEYYFLTPDVA